jgi:Ca2+-binding RTX toxin-like protein
MREATPDRALRQHGVMRRCLISLLIALLAATGGASALAQVQIAATRNGGPGPDRLVGTAGSDRLNGRGGNDRIGGRGGPDRETGGSGNDVMFGDAGRDVMAGGPGNDQLLGGAGSDRLSGGGGNDVLAGGVGNDSINSRDGQADRVSCGPGRDTVTRDRFDSVAGDCERR